MRIHAYSMLVALLLSTACGSESSTPSVAGTYTLNMTRQTSECGIIPTEAGASASGIVVVITQSSSDPKAITGVVQGTAAFYLGLLYGKTTFEGTVQGNALDLILKGTVPGASGGCAYTRDARLTGILTKDSLDGQIAYTYATNHHADCGTKDTCQDVFLMNGSRPPTASP